MPDVAEILGQKKAELALAQKELTDAKNTHSLIHILWR